VRGTDLGLFELRLGEVAASTTEWSADAKARIVAEILEPSAVVAEVARRWKISPQQVLAWRREMRAATAARVDFVPIVPAISMALPEPPGAPACSSPSIEVEVAGAVLRVTPGADADLLTTLLQALRVSTA